MSDNVVRFPGSAPTLKEMLQDAVTLYPKATAMVLTIFEDGDMHNLHYCNKEEMACAGARLIYLAGMTDDLPRDGD